ncbi:carboxylesterase family protein, partial [Streptomyces sp. NPDC041003]|uniref:carboxylesterase family protein n=1 Tax=Streptomyces sp. NPDC041003 TaxID=3155730 RepID=UPI0033F1F9B1
KAFGAAGLRLGYLAAHPAGVDAVQLVRLPYHQSRMPAVSLAERRAARGRPVWAYQFDLPTPAYDGQLRSAHCLELPFAFNNFDKWSQAPFLAGLDPRVRDGLASTMHASWISFIRTGDPNPGPMPNWARYERGSRTTMRLDSVTSAVDDLAGYWRRLHQPTGR